MTTPAVVAAPAMTGRGRTVIDDRVRRRLVERAVLSVPGVVPRRTMVPGRTLPAVVIGGQRHEPRVNIEIAARWPVVSGEVIDGVRTAVGAELATALGEHPADIDVRIARLEADRSPAQVADAYAAPDDMSAGPGSASRRLAPRSIAASTVTGVLIALALTAVGAVAIRDAVTSDTEWIGTALGWLGNAHWQWWLWPAAVVAALVGLVLLVAAVKPRRRTHVPVGDGVWVPRGLVNDWQVDDSASTTTGLTGEDS